MELKSNHEYCLYSIQSCTPVDGRYSAVNVDARAAFSNLDFGILWVVILLEILLCDLSHDLLYWLHRM